MQANPPVLKQISVKLLRLQKSESREFCPKLSNVTGFVPSLIPLWVDCDCRLGFYACAFRQRRKQAGAISQIAPQCAQGWTGGKKGAAVLNPGQGSLVSRARVSKGRSRSPDPYSPVFSTPATLSPQYLSLKYLKK